MHGTNIPDSGDRQPGYTEGLVERFINEINDIVIGLARHVRDPELIHWRDHASLCLATLLLADPGAAASIPAPIFAAYKVLFYERVLDPAFPETNEEAIARDYQHPAVRS
jgi:hypothetical protein